MDLGDGTTGDPLEDLARPVWDLAKLDPALAATFVRAYESAADVKVALNVLRDYVVLDLLVLWEYGTRPAQSWFADPTFEAWSTSFVAPVNTALRAIHDGA